MAHDANTVNRLPALSNRTLNMISLTSAIFSFGLRRRRGFSTSINATWYNVNHWMVIMFPASLFNIQHNFFSSGLRTTKDKTTNPPTTTMITLLCWEAGELTYVNCITWWSKMGTSDEAETAGWRKPWHAIQQRRHKTTPVLCSTELGSSQKQWFWFAHPGESNEWATRILTEFLKEFSQKDRQMV